jgi:hypothetical protein
MITNKTHKKEKGRLAQSDLTRLGPNDKAAQACTVERQAGPACGRAAQQRG